LPRVLASLDRKDLSKFVILALRELQEEARLKLGLDAEDALSKVILDWKEPDNQTLKIDLSNSMRLRYLILKKYGDQVRILGEESFGGEPIDLSDEERPIFLLDPMDGSDLIARQLANWCIAVLVYSATALEVVAAFVADSYGQVYYAVDQHDGAFVLPPGDDAKPRTIHPAQTKEVHDCYASFYGQKPKNLRAVLDCPELIDDDRGVKRIYNLGGNPMLAKIADGSMDVVFETLGQKPHDAVPGLFIAEKAGAAICEPSGKPLDWSASLLKPDSKRLCYVAACCQELGNGIVDCVQAGA
jgi:fructose-1,6-bisphosphatase/inositol monophosphatase family enzyme